MMDWIFCLVLNVVCGFGCAYVSYTHTHIQHKHTMFCIDVCRVCLLQNFMYIYIYIYTHIYTHIHTYAHTHICTHTHTHAHTYLHTTHTHT
jgi:hypothetical protein